MPRMARAVVPGRLWLAKPGAPVTLKDPAARATPKAPGDREATDVLVTRVHGLIDKATWTRRYGQICDFEAHLTSEGTKIVKFFLHVSKDEQRKRLQDRIDAPDERWKFSGADLPERERWDDYQEAFGDAIAATTTDAAPWHVIPADHKWYRDWAVASTLQEVLTALDPQYPQAAPGIEGMVVP